MKVKKAVCGGGPVVPQHPSTGNGRIPGCSFILSVGGLVVQSHLRAVGHWVHELLRMLHSTAPHTHAMAVG